MSLSYEYYCKHCHFSFIGGYSISSYATVKVLDFPLICKNCLASLFVYSGDLGYLRSDSPCFLLQEYLASDTQGLSTVERRLWKRRLRRATKAEKKRLKLERAQLQERIIRQNLQNRVALGIPLEVREANGLVHVGLEGITCPYCAAVGTIALGFSENELCPQCGEEVLVNFL